MRTERDFDAELAEQRWRDSQAERKAWDQLLITLDRAARHVVENRMERFGDGCGGAVLAEWRMALERHLGRPLEEASWPRTVRGAIKRKNLSTTACLAVFAKDGYQCVRCGTGEELTVDHIHPVALGGGDEPENLQTLCKRCNSRKGTKVI